MADGLLLAALQATLAGEHAAVWACGRAAAELAGDQRQAALVELDAHRRARDGLRGRISALGAEPVASAPAYAEPEPVTGASSARGLLAHVGAALCAVYADLAAASPAAARRGAAVAATTCARRALTWGAAPEAFPGEALPGGPSSGSPSSGSPSSGSPSPGADPG